MEMQQDPSSSSAGRIDGKSKPELTAYAKVDTKSLKRHPRCIPVMVSTTASSGMIDLRAPLDLVVVLHIREGYNVPKNWMELLTKAMDVIVDKLESQDRLAVIPGRATLMRARKFEASEQVVTSDTLLVKALELAESILHSRQLEDKEHGQEHKNKKWRNGNIIVISNIDEGIGSLLPWRFRSVHAFGFRDAHNARTMHTISSTRNCTYAVLDEEHGQITQAFLATISRITSAITAMPTEVKLKCDQKVVLTAIDTPGTSYFISYDKKAGIIWPSVHLAGVTTNFISYLDDNLQHSDLPQLLTVGLKYGNVLDKLGVQVVTKGMDGSKQVVAEMVRVEAVKIVASIVAKDKNDWEQLHAAADDLREQWSTLEKSDWGSEAAEEGMISGLAAQMREMEVRLYNNYYWLEYMLSWQSHQQWQLPLPQPLMGIQSTNNEDDHPIPMQLRILAKAHHVVQETITEHQKALPVMVSVTAQEAGLAMVKRASVDLILVIDASYGDKVKEKKILERRQLLIEAKLTEVHHSKAKKLVDELEKSLEQLINAKVEDEKRMGMQGEVTEKRNKMNSMADKIKKLENQAMELEKDVNKLKENTDKRLDLLGRATGLVKKTLSLKDRLAIIPVKSSITEPATDLFQKKASNEVQQMSMPLTYNKAAAAQVLPDAGPKFPKIDRKMKALHWREHPKRAMRLIRNCLHSAPSSSTPTPPSAKSQGTNYMTAHSTDDGGSTNMLHKALMDAMKILDDRRGEEKNRQGYIIVISDSDDDSICMETLSPNHMVHAFGFYGRHNTRALYHIASSCNGIYNIINDDRNQITEAFTSCINKMTSTIAVDTKVEIMCSPASNAALSTIESGPFRYSIGKDRKSSSVWIGALSAGTVKNFIIYVDNVSEDDYDNFSKYFTVCVKWGHYALNRVEKLEGQVVVVSDGMEGYKEVVENIDHVVAVKIATGITGHRGMMGNMLKQMRNKCPEFERSAGDDRLKWLADQMKKMDAYQHSEIIGSNDYKNMVAEKLSYILSWLSYQRSYCWITII